MLRKDSRFTGFRANLLLTSWKGAFSESHSYGAVPSRKMVEEVLAPLVHRLGGYANKILRQEGRDGVVLRVVESICILVITILNGLPST